MKYEFAEEADESLSAFEDKIVHELLMFIDEARNEGFYNHDSYSYVYDHRGQVWDKLDAKEGFLDHRIFFREIDSTIYILDIFEREDMDYEDKGLYNRLKKVSLDE